MSFFGGDPNVSHFTANVRWRVGNEKEGERRERTKAERAVLRQAGFPGAKFFKFKNKDEAGKAKAKAECEAFASAWNSKTGVVLEVCEGCFL